MEHCKIVIELYKNSLISILESDKPVDAELFTDALRKINRSIDEAAIAGKPHEHLNELKDYVSVLKYDILMKHGKY